MTNVVDTVWPIACTSPFWAINYLYKEAFMAHVESPMAMDDGLCRDMGGVVHAQYEYTRMQLLDSVCQ